MSVRVMRVEVFRTNVADRHQANWLIDQIQNAFQDYNASFDLEDCDRILVVKCATAVHPLLVINLLKSHGCYAEVLPDDWP